MSTTRIIIAFLFVLSFASTASADSQIQTTAPARRGPIVGFSPLGGSVGDGIGGMLFSAHLGWRFDKSFAVEVLADQAIQPVQPVGQEDAPNSTSDQDFISGSNSIVAAGVKLWPTSSESFWVSAAVGIGSINESDDNQRRPAGTIRMGKLLSKHVGVHVSVRGGYYDQLRTATGVGLSIAWGQ